jgi:ribonuclease H / adenosylcobalamin/alpha-ribazole phosphatase
VSGGIEHVVVEADGGSRGNPGPAGYGAVVRDPADGMILLERNEAIGTETNNVAEYRGLIAGLQAAHEVGARRVSVRMDSKLVVEQMKGTWQVKNPALRELARTAAALRMSFADVTFEWIPRERNKEADRLANEAMDAAAGKPARKTAKKAPTVDQPAVAWSPPTGEPARFVLVRHGATVHSPEHRLSGRNDLPLSETGQQQAQALAERGFGDDVVAVVSSPLPRARQTAEVIAAALGLELLVVDGLAEMDFGDWEGRTIAEVRGDDPSAVDAWTADPRVAAPGGESFDDVGRRVRRARDEILARHRHGTVVVVSHVTPIKWLITSALDAPTSALFRIHLDTASVSRVDYFPDGNCSLALLNDTAHLR